MDQFFVDDAQIDAFFEEQDKRMNEPDDDMDEFLARMASRRNRPPDFYSLDISVDRTPSNSVPEVSYGANPSNESIRPSSESVSLPSAKRKETNSGFVPPPTSKRSKNAPAEDKTAQIPSPIPTRKSPRKHNPTPPRTSLLPSIRQTSPHHESDPGLKRKRSLTKPEKPAWKKVAIDDSIQPSSPIEVFPKPVSKPVSEKPPSKKLKPSKKAVRPSVKIPPQTSVPEMIDLSLSPIEEPDFSVLVSRFEPETTSTQPKVIATSSTFLEMKERVEKKKLLKASKSSAKIAGSSKTGPRDAVSGDESVISISSSPSPRPEPNVIRPIKASTKPRPKPKPQAQPAAVAKPAVAKKGKKKERVRMFPKDFAQMLKEAPPPLAKNPFLKDKNLFYTGGDMSWASETTMGRMKNIVKYGGNLFPVFDGALVTHIISETGIAPTLRALGLKSLKDIPEHIPVVRWKWVVDGMDDSEPGPLFEYAAFIQRIPPVDAPGRTSSKGKDKGKQRASELSHISDFTQDKKQPNRNIHDSEDDDDEPDARPASPAPHKKASTSRVKIEDKDDPLAEFYALAKADRDAEGGCRLGEAEDPDETDVEDGPDSEDEAQQNPGPAPRKGGWTCDSKNAQRKNGPNELVAQKLEELMGLHKAKLGEDNHWRGYTYQKVVRAVRNYPKRIKSFDEALSIQHVGKKTALKIMEIIETGNLRRIGYENTPDVQIRKLFQGIYGVGQATAYQWYAGGCRTLDDLLAGKGGVTLTPAQKIGIQFYDDINDRMPRAEAKALFELIKPIALGIDPKLEIHIMGSYRRGKADCGDIDIMITRCPDDGKTHAGILHHLLKALHEKKIITEDLALPDDPFDEEAIYRGLCHLPQFGSRRRRIDFLTVPWKSRGAALLYYTGDDIFNRAIRYKANRLGYSLNQKGLFAGVVRDPRQRTVKTNTGNVIASETEEEIFRMLDVPFQQPHERVRG
ncbi:DNA polymerase lambda [Mycena galericulata]|nr:DNA polymerase lambda [Mycena galericulata]